MLAAWNISGWEEDTHLLASKLRKELLFLDVITANQPWNKEESISTGPQGTGEQAGPQSLTGFSFS